MGKHDVIHKPEARARWPNHSDIGRIIGLDVWLMFYSCWHVIRVLPIKVKCAVSLE